jgi:hypothetical protein
LIHQTLNEKRSVFTAGTFLFCSNPGSKAKPATPWSGLGWRAQGDDLRTFLGNFVAALPHLAFPTELTH